MALEWKSKLAEVFNRGFWDGYYLGAKMGEWSSIYGSQATKRKVFVGKCTNWFSRLGVAEIEVQATELRKGDELMFIGNSTGIVQITVDDLRVDYQPADVCPQGKRCSVAVPLDSMPVDLANQSPDMTPGERFHPRRGDKVYIWR